MLYKQFFKVELCPSIFVTKVYKCKWNIKNMLLIMFWLCVNFKADTLRLKIVCLILGSLLKRKRRRVKQKKNKRFKAKRKEKRQELKMQKRLKNKQKRQNLKQLKKQRQNLKQLKKQKLKLAKTGKNRGDYVNYLNIY
jgi:hypothetical protein